MENRLPVENLERLAYSDKVIDKTSRVTSLPLTTTMPREDYEGRLIKNITELKITNLINN